MSQISIITTSDGSHSLLNADLNETYHSTHGALQESQHVFIKNGLDQVLAETSDAIEVLEIGFGTGLNAFLTLQRATEAKRKIRYTTLEVFPLDENIWSNLNYTSSLGSKDLFASLHHALWGVDQNISEFFTILKIKQKLQDEKLPRGVFDLVYFDAFAPNKQPEMWELSTLKLVTDSMREGAVLVTYCAKGQVKRDLKSLSLRVETLPGPPGKKEMIRACKLSQ
jgi:tRNA U34 5-methylaminomethyl-2-thiouridine-forming methyltransferase MnmC